MIEPAILDKKQDGSIRIDEIVAVLGLSKSEAIEVSRRCLRMGWSVSIEGSEDQEDQEILLIPPKGSRSGPSAIKRIVWKLRYGWIFVLGGFVAGLTGSIFGILGYFWR